MATIQTGRVLCDVEGDMAHVRFQSAEVAEYTEAEKLPEDFRMIADNYDFSVMIIDCEALKFATSTLLCAFVEVQMHLASQDREVRVCNLNPLIQNMFRITRLGQIITICSDLDSAMERK